ncbi:MAG: gliding motility-associated C-terminal domain-containing protein [Bacteroidota bacterium]
MLNQNLRYATLFLLVIRGTLLCAQPTPCADAMPDMTPFCADACIICDIDGFTGRHESDINGEAPNDFCTLFVHNAQWIAFIAGSEELAVEIEVSNCQLGGGLEIAIYESLDCENFTLLSNCFGAQNAVAEGSSGVVTVNTPLTIGQYYYIVMDGQMGDNCDWTLNVVTGDTQVAPLNSSGNITGDLSVCPGISTTYTTEAGVGATNFDWALNGQSIPSEGPVTNIEWTTDGIYELCVTASNVCNAALPSCQQIEVASIPTQLLTEQICEGDCFALNDTLVLCDPGNFTFNFLTEKGCDSTVFVDLSFVPESITPLDLAICEGDSIFIGPTPYFQTGDYTTILDNYLGCDSTVNLNLLTIVCELQGVATTIPVVCFGEATGEIQFSVEDGTSPFNYFWERIGSGAAGTGVLSAINTVEQISNLAAGTYLITINDDFGNDLILIEEVTEPQVLNTELVTTDYNGFNVSCFAERDGTLTAIPVGGVSPYTYSWSNGEQGAVINDLTSGNYAVTITDAFGCQITAAQTLNEPELLSMIVDFTNPNCDGFDTGEVTVEQTTGGVPPYLYQFATGGFVNESTVSNLVEDTYTIIVQDTNGCEADTTASLTAPIIPNIELGEDLTVDLGESVAISVTSNVLLDTVSWSDEPGLSCYDCPQPTARPFNTTPYRLTVVSEDDCVATDSLTVFVNKRRRVYVPNVFSPNNDGVNDRFYLFGGIEVLAVRRLQIFSRWGELLHEQTDVPINNHNGGWNGEFRREEVPTGSYAWVAEVEFLDGFRTLYNGEVILLR